jgi:hypothetical protein
MAKQAGFLLIAAVVLIVVGAVLAASIAFLAVSGGQSAVVHLGSKQALFVAGSGLERGIRALLASELGERLRCGTVTGNVNLTNVAFADGLFTVTANNGGVPYYPAIAATLTAAVGTADSIIPISSLAEYAGAGRVVIDREAIDYAGTSNDSAVCGLGLTPCLVGAQRGRDGTLAAAHANGAPVGQFQCDLESHGGVPDLTNVRGKRILRIGVQLQETWAVGDLAGNDFTFIRWNQPIETQWSDASFTDAANRERLNGISMLSYADGWAVGNSRGADFTFVRRTAAGWVAQPLTDAANRPDLNGVYCISHDDCWAVGDSKGGNFTFVQRTAAGWTAQPLSSGDRENLNSVHCIATDDCWAVGDSRGNNFTFVKYTGAWALQQLNDGNQRDLFGVFCVALDDCWAVGQGGVILRLTAIAPWSVFAAPGAVTASDLNGVACTTTNDCWAVGNGGVTLHWDGTAWAAVASPTGQNLRAVAVIAGRQRPQAAWREIYP